MQGISNNRGFIKEILAELKLISRKEVALSLCGFIGAIFTGMSWAIVPIGLNTGNSVGGFAFFFGWLSFLLYLIVIIVSLFDGVLKLSENTKAYIYNVAAPTAGLCPLLFVLFHMSIEITVWPFLSILPSVAATLIVFNILKIK